jgi:cell division protein FtsW (lipid II flippase)
MGVTISTAAERRRRVTPGSGGLWDAQPGRPSRNREALLLAAAAAVLVFGLLLVTRAVSVGVPETAARLASGAAVDLSRIDRIEQLLPVLAPLEGGPDRRRAVAGAILNRAQEGRIPNLGALARLRIAVTSGDQPNADPAGERLLSGAELRRLRPNLVVRSPADFRLRLWLWAGLSLAAFAALHLFFRLRGFTGDQLVLPALLLLAGTGFLMMVSLRDPLRDLLLFQGFAQGVVFGAVLLGAVSLLDPDRSPLRRLQAIPLFAALALSTLLVLFGSGPGGSDAKVNLFGVQPVEAVKLLVVLFLAGYFADRWEFLRELRNRALPPMLQRLRLPRLDYALPPLVALGAVLFFFFLQRDLGPALVLSFLFLLLYAVARARAAMALAGTALVVAAFWVGYRIGYPRTVTRRIEMWLSPWDTWFPGGDHLAQSLWSLAAGGWAGAGLGRGEPEQVPEAHTDLILAAIGEELGFLGLAAVLVLYGLLLQRGWRAARRSEGVYGFFLALGLTLLLGLQIVLIGGGVLGLLPLSGVASPFLSFGRSAMLGNFLLAGLLLAVSAHAAPAAATAGASEAPATLPLRRLRGPARLGVLLLAGALATIGLRAAWIQLARPDQVLTRGAVAIQADGYRRFRYDPRLQEIADSIPRGTIVDRNGLPLATSNPADLTRYQAAYRKLLTAGGTGQRSAGVPAGVGAGAGTGSARVYPLGGYTYHLLGDLGSRVNWGAPNTSFAERDFRIRLQGYDDYAAVVDVAQPPKGSDRTARLVRRDYSELLPLLRLRDRPKHEAVRKILDRDRTLHTTLDARLQVRATAALAKAVAEAGHGGAAVVMDARTGELLASVSLPLPKGLPRAIAGVLEEAEPGKDTGLIDRARYGIYSPGSTFKLVTAMAALRRDPALARKTFSCVAVGGGRVGNRVPGWRRLIRDDVTVHAPHGTVDMETGIRRSCNAYFAQLGGLEVGPAALIDTAKRFGIEVAEPNTPEQLKSLLPQASYGQGEVTATAFQMARVAATVASGGMRPEGRWVVDPSDPRNAPPERVVSAENAAVLARAMRGVVTSGTAARQLSEIVPPAAGKTGTAEVTGKPSHSWFIGFSPAVTPETALVAGGPGSPAGPAGLAGSDSGRRIAVAVIVEHGGYGGRLATQAAREILLAAAELGLIR